MWPGRYLVGSVAVQALGAAATFGTGLAIAWQQGPQAQGHYGLLRTTADMLLALALFGLPQSMVQAIHHQGASPAWLERSSLRYGAGLMALWALAVLALADTPLPWPPWLDGPWALLALGLAVCGWLAQGLLRALVLCVGDALRFAWASVLPALTLLVAVGAVLALGSSRFEWALAASGLASLGLIWHQLRVLRALSAWSLGGPARLPTLAGSGALAMAQTSAFALQPWLTLQILQGTGPGIAETGLFVFAALVYQAFTLPASFAAPLLLERVSRAERAGQRLALRRRLAPVLGLTVAAGLAIAALVPWAVPRAFGAAYDAAVPACIWMAICGPVVVAGRLAVSVLLGQGAFRAAALHALVRVLATPVSVLLALAWGPADRPAAVAIAWFIIEAGALALALQLCRRRADVR